MRMKVQEACALCWLKQWRMVLLTSGSCEERVLSTDGLTLLILTLKDTGVQRRPTYGAFLIAVDSNTSDQLNKH